MLLHDLFSNSPNGNRDFTINFFYERSAGVPTAQLACPFYSNIEPLKILRNAGCTQIRLLVRLCAFTSPSALRETRDLGDVQVRFFTDESFHAKFYILGNVALIGSANLTGAGLKSNRELSVTVTSSEERFDDILALFDELWQRASVLTDDALEKFTTWSRNQKVPVSSHIDGIDDISPQTVKVESKVVTRERTYLESYRQEYNETLIPNYRIIKEIYESLGRRQADFANYPFTYEIDRLLSWIKLTFTTDDELLKNPIRGGADLRQNIREHLEKWFATKQIIDEVRVQRLIALKSIFADEHTLSAVSFPDLTDALLGCAAFDEQLRFTKGGQESLMAAFQKDNSLETVRVNFHNLAFGDGDFVRRTYDCIYAPELKLRHFGRSSIMELFGWINKEDIPPLNMRAAKAMRYLGFDVRT
jgi:hypothetical protein